MGAVDHVVAAFAAAQHGVVARAQLVEAGVSPEAIKHRVAQGRLTPLHRGVYRLGETHTSLTSLMAATLACGPTAALSHHAAAALHGIAKARPGPVDVTVTTGHARRRRGLRVHRARSIETTTVQGIPTTTLTRTLLDLASQATQRELRRAIEEAQIHHGLTDDTLARAVDEARGHRGARALRAAGEQARGPRLTRSEAERRLLELIDAAGLPPPRTNARVGAWEVDVLWPQERLVVEVDGFAFHSTREAFERDRRKDAELQDARYRVMRITWRQLLHEREVIVARLARGLGGTLA